MRLALVAVLVLGHAAAQSWEEGQLPDGSWPALLRAGAAAGGEIDAPPGDLRATAAAMLADLARGSTLKEGERKDALRRAAHWMRSQLDDDTGRFRAGSLEDMALASYALAAAHVLSAYRTLRPAARSATLGVLARLDTPDAAEPVTPATRALAMLAAEAFHEVTAEHREAVVRWFDAHPHSHADAPLARVASELLCRQILDPGWAAIAAPPLADRLLAADLAGDARPDELTVFLATAALARLGGPTWEAWSRKLGQRRAPTTTDSAADTASAALEATTLAARARTAAGRGQRRALPAAAGYAARPGTVTSR